MKEQEMMLSKLYRKIIRETLFPLFLMIATVNVAITLPYFVVNKNSYARVLVELSIPELVSEAWAAINWFDLQIWTIVLTSAIWAILSLMLPGDMYQGPPTLTGFKPTYFKSGFKFYLISMMIYCPLIWYCSMLHLYYKFVTLAGILTVVGLIVCVGLFIKGHLSPSPGIFGSSGSVIFDFYWGLELYPRFDTLSPRLDFKTIVNCRFGLWLWQLIVLAAWKANFELYQASYNRGTFNYAMTASTILQTVYLAKFYFWEDGYMYTIDISVDKFGFMVSWGCIAWVPTFYTLTSIYLVKHSPMNAFGFWSFILIVSFGCYMIYLNYSCDLQRQSFRALNGKMNIWGKPARIIHAIYQTSEGHSKQSILLSSGFWAMARHINYTFELASALAWSLPGHFNSPVPYLYFLFLFVLLVHRSLRDETKCKNKYTKYWDIYCEQVPYKILPYVY